MSSTPMRWGIMKDHLKKLVSMMALPLTFGQVLVDNTAYTIYIEPEPISALEAQEVIVDVPGVESPLESDLEALKAEIPEGFKENPLIRRARLLDGEYGGQCVGFVKSFLRLDEREKWFVGNAGSFERNATEPSIGSVVLINSSVAHIAVVIDIEDDEIILAESNWSLDEIIGVGRRMKIDDPRIRGYIEFDQEWDFDNTIDYIVYSAQEAGVSVRLALDLATEESGFDPLAKNPLSSAKGIYQITFDTFNENCEGDVFEVEHNVSCAMDMISRGMISRWSVDENICNMLIEKGHLEQC